MASGLRQRVATALLLAALVVVILFWLPPAAAVAAVLLVVAAGAWEWAGFMGSDRRSLQRLVYAAAMGALMALGWWATTKFPGLQRAILWIAATWWTFALGWLFRFPTRIPVPMSAHG